MGPSPIGSENGTPNSITLAPPFWSASIAGTVSALSGYPAVMNVTNAGVSCTKGNLRASISATKKVKKDPDFGDEFNRTGKEPV